MNENLRARGIPRQVLLAVAATAVAAAGGVACAVTRRRERNRAARLHRTLVEVLLNALSSGDPLTARHCRRVADLADSLAAPLPMNGAEHATLRVAALLHDMGKIEDELFPLVHSTEPLDADQQERMHHHPSESAFILQPLESFHPGLVRIVASHHEAWNGTGYPAGLRGEEIPLAARIIAVADVFDALTQPRSYREPCTPVEVLDTIRAAAGERFDPYLVELLGRGAVRDRWLRIAERGRLEEASAAAEAGTDVDSSTGRTRHEPAADRA